MQPNPKAACNSPQKYTEPGLSLRTNGWSGSSKNNGEGKHTWPFPNTYTQAQTHTQSHSFGAFHTYGKQEVHYTDGTAMGWVVRVTPAGCFIYHNVQMCLSSRYNIWTFTSVTSDVKKAGQYSVNCCKPLSFYVFMLVSPTRFSFLCLWMALPGLQRTQEIESVIVYVSSPISRFFACIEGEQRHSLLGFCVCTLCFRTISRSQSFLAAAGAHMLILIY